MATYGKTVIGAILISTLVVFLAKVAALFPFFMTMVTETFNLANIASADNYIKDSYYQQSLKDLRERPFFNKLPDRVEINVYNASDRWAVGSDDEYEYINDSPDNKPYMQKGDPVRIEVKAKYPFEFTIWGQTVSYEAPMSFRLTCYGLKYYKDLDMDNPYDLDGDPASIDYYDDFFYDTDIAP
jgi:hypothetical protein